MWNGKIADFSCLEKTSKEFFNLGFFLVKIFCLQDIWCKMLQMRRPFTPPGNGNASPTTRLPFALFRLRGVLPTLTKRYYHQANSFTVTN